MQLRLLRLEISLTFSKGFWVFEAHFLIKIYLSETTKFGWLTWIPDCDSHGPALLDFFLSSGPSNCSTRSFPSIGKLWSCCCLSFHWISFILEKGCPFSLYCWWDWDGLRDHLRDVLWENILKLVASAAATEFFEWDQVGNNVYAPHRKYQVKSHSFSWFSAACFAAIAHKNSIFNAKVNLLYFLFSCPELLSSTFDEAKLLAESFS